MPDASTLSQNRRRGFAESTIYQDIFAQIVELAVNKGLASGTVLYSDSTHLKANANKNQFDVASGGQAGRVFAGAGCGHRSRPRRAWQEASEGAARGRAGEEGNQGEPHRSDAGYMVREGKSARTASYCRIEPPIVKGTGSTTPMPNSAATAGAPQVHASIERDQGHYTACVGGEPGADGPAPPEPGGQADLQAKEGDGGAQLRRQQTTARAPLRPLRGLRRVPQQCLLAATAQNINKIALLLSRTEPNLPVSTLTALLTTYISQLRQYQQIAAFATKGS